MYIVLKGDTLYNRVTKQYGEALSNDKKDGTVTVRPAFRPKTQWNVADVEVQEPMF